MRMFQAKQTFHSTEMQSDYIEGLTYTIRQGNRYLDLLAEVWAKEGKIVFFHHAPAVTVSGVGEVRDLTPTEKIRLRDMTLWEKVKEAASAIWREGI